MLKFLLILVGITTAAPPPNLCTDTCKWRNDNECDDGGHNSDYDVCRYGTDCTDCGPRWIYFPTPTPTPPPSTPPPSTPPPEPSTHPPPIVEPSPSPSPDDFPPEYSSGVFSPSDPPEPSPSMPPPSSPDPDNSSIPNLPPVSPPDMPPSNNTLQEAEDFYRVLLTSVNTCVNMTSLCLENEVCANYLLQYLIELDT